MKIVGMLAPYCTKNAIMRCFTGTFAYRRVQTQDRALWAFLGGENKHHILYTQFITGSIDTILHENAIIRLLHEHLSLEEGANTAGGCRIMRCGRF